MLKHIKRTTAVLLSILTIFTMLTVMLPTQVSASTVGNDIKSYDEILQDVIDEYGEVFTNEDVGEIISYSGYILAKDYAEILYNRQNSDTSVSSKVNTISAQARGKVNTISAQARAMTYTPEFSYCYDTGGNKITVRKAMIGQYVGECALLMQVNGRRVYCIEPGKSLNTNSEMITTSDEKNTTSYIWSQFGDDKKRALRLALCCGREGNNKAITSGTTINNDQSYLATQLIVWEIRNDERSSTAPYNLKSGKSGYLDIYCANGSNGNIKSAYNRIIATMQKFDKIPSFMKSSKSSAPTITLNADYSTTYNEYNITDTVVQYDANQVLSGYGYFDSLNNKIIDVNNGKIKITQKGNQVTFSIISADINKTGKTYSLGLTKNVTNDTGADFTAYSQKDSKDSKDWQDLIAGGSVDKPSAYLNIKLNIASHGIQRDARIYKSVYTTTEWASPDVHEGEGALSTSENIKGWYYYVTVPDDFKEWYDTDHIILGPTNEQGYTQYISEYIKEYIDPSIKYDVPIGYYDCYELGRLKDGYDINALIRKGRKQDYLPAFELPEGYEEYGTFEQAFGARDAIANVQIRLAGGWENSKPIGYSSNKYHPSLDIVKSCEDGSSPDGYYFKIVNNETKQERIVGPTTNGTIHVKYEARKEHPDAGFFVDGTYTITELGLKNSNNYYIPEWYVAPDPITVKISAQAYINAQQAGYDAIQVGFENKCQGRIGIHKTDSTTRKNVPNAKYGIYTDRDLTKQIAAITTDENGYAESDNIAIGEYYVQEISATNYNVNSTVYTVHVEAKHVAIASNIYTVETTDNPYIKLQLSKSSANSKITNGNSCYSLKDAVYTVYTSSTCSPSSKVGTITTDSDGYGYFNAGSSAERNTSDEDRNTVFYNKISGGNVELKPGVTYYCKETTAPKNYKLNNTVYTFKDSGATTSKGVKIYRPYDNYGSLPTDTPNNDPLTINISKKNSTTNEISTNLNGAVFRVSYYDTIISKDIDVTSKTDKSDIPTLNAANLQRVWYIETKTTNGTPGVAHLDKDHLIDTSEFPSGPLYLDKYGVPCIPIGLIVIEEVQAPNGYFVNDTVFYRQITTESIEISEENGAIQIPINEQPASGYIGIHKMNKSGSEVANAVYGLYSDANCRTKIAELTTTTSKTGDVFDIAVNLNQTYYIKEISAPPDTAYVVDTTVYPVTPTESNTTKQTAVIQDVYENADKGNVTIQKTATDGNVANLWFALVDETNKIEYTAKKTSKTGKVTWTGVPMITDSGATIKYTVKELGYRMTNIGTSTDDYFICAYAGQTWYVIRNLCTQYKGIWYEPISVAAGAEYTNGHPYSKYQYGGTSVGNTYGVNFWFDSQSSRNPADVTFSSDGKTATVQMRNSVPVTDVNVVKTSYDGIVKDFYFDVYDQFGTLCGEIRTDEHGEGTLAGLPSCMSISISGVTIPIQYKVVEKGFKKADGTYYLPDNYKQAYESPLRGANFNNLFSGKRYTIDDNGIYHYAITFNAYNDADTAPINVTKKSDDKIVENVGFKIEAYDGNSRTTLGWDKNGNALTEITIITDENGNASSNDVQLYSSNKKPMDGLLKYVVASESNKFNERRYITYHITELGFKNSDGTFTYPIRYRNSETRTCTLQNASTDEPYTFKWTNKLVYGKVTLHKTDYNERALANSKWQLYDANTNKLLKLTQTGIDVFFVDDIGRVDEVTVSSGELFIYNIPIGNYYLIETEAPNGYMKYEGKIPFSVKNNGDNADIELEFTVIDNKSLLPKTGQFGAIPIYIGSAILLLASVVGLVIYKKKRKHMHII